MNIIDIIQYIETFHFLSKRDNQYSVDMLNLLKRNPFKFYKALVKHEKDMAELSKIYETIGKQTL